MDYGNMDLCIASRELICFSLLLTVMIVLSPHSFFIMCLRLRTSQMERRVATMTETEEGFH